MDNYLDSEKEDSSMLHSNSHECPSCLHSTQPTTSKGSLRFNTFIWFFFIPALVSVSVFTILVSSAKLRIGFADKGCDSWLPTTQNLGFMPTSDPLEFYNLQPMADAWITSPYAGYPSEAKGLAWDKLQAVRGARVSITEGKQINLPDGLRLESGDHATITGVMHNLHCLRMIRQYIYPDYYYPNATSEKMEYLQSHSDHCIETLRESVTCLPDLTPHALFWVDVEELIHVNLKPQVKRQCVKWDSLVRWQKKREYSLNELWESNPKEMGSQQ